MTASPLIRGFGPIWYCRIFTLYFKATWDIWIFHLPINILQNVNQQYCSDWTWLLRSHWWGLLEIHPFGLKKLHESCTIWMKVSHTNPPRAVCTASSHHQLVHRCQLRTSSKAKSLCYHPNNLMTCLITHAVNLVHLLTLILFSHTITWPLF